MGEPHRHRYLIRGGLAVVVGIGVFVASVTLLGVARRSMVAQVERAERLAVHERATALSGALDNAQQRFEVNLRQVVLQSAYEHGDVATLQQAIDQARRTPGIRAVTVLGHDGSVVASTGPPIRVPVGTAPQYLPGGDRRQGIMVLTAPFSGGSVALEVELTALVPQLTNDIPYTGGAVSVVAGRRTILTTRRAGATGEGELSVSEAVGDRPLRVVVSASAAAADRPATALVWRLGGILAALLGAIALVIGATAAVMLRSRRRLVRSHEDALQLARRDPLTGLANRRAFDERVDATMATSGLCGVIAIDMDRLKRLNDADGHLAGDQALRSVAEAIRSVVRPADFVARTGGDEFLVVLPDVTPAELEHVAARVRSAVALVGLSVSCGVAHGHNHQLPDLVRASDQRLYDEKRAHAVL